MDNTETIINEFLKKSEAIENGEATENNDAANNGEATEIGVSEKQTSETQTGEKQNDGFKQLGLMPKLLQTISEQGYETPTPIQAEAIPLILEGQDIMGLAQTGTGKTAAFGLPLIQLLAKEDRHPEPREVRALILAPTRELAKQISDNIRGFIQRTNLRCTVVVGGASIHFQKKKLEKGTDILVATPGRLMDLVDRKALYLDKASFLVLDEADQMLDLGFIHVLRKIAKLVRKPRQTMLFSATMPKQISTLAQAYLTDPVRIEVARQGKAADKVTQCVHFVDQGAKAEFLRECLSKNSDDLSLVFSRTKHGAEKLMKRLAGWGFKTNSIHGNKSQGQRERAIKAFRDGETRVLVATDVAARGIDIPGVSHVYNFDLPDVPENYIHRIGRTARAGKDGQAVAFCSSGEVKLLRAIQNLMKMTIDVASGEMAGDMGGDSRNRGRGRGRNQSNGQGQGQGRGRGNSNGGRGHARSNRGPEQASKEERWEKAISGDYPEESFNAQENSGEQKPNNKRRRNQGRNQNQHAGQNTGQHEGRNDSRNDGQKPGKPKKYGKSRKPNGAKNASANASGHSNSSNQSGHSNNTGQPSSANSNKRPRGGVKRNGRRNSVAA